MGPETTLYVLHFLFQWYQKVNKIILSHFHNWTVFIILLSQRPTCCWITVDWGWDMTVAGVTSVWPRSSGASGPPASVASILARLQRGMELRTPPMIRYDVICVWSRGLATTGPTHCWHQPVATLKVVSVVPTLMAHVHHRSPPHICTSPTTSYTQTCTFKLHFHQYVSSKCQLVLFILLLKATLYTKHPTPPPPTPTQDQLKAASTQSRPADPNCVSKTKDRQARPSTRTCPDVRTLSDISPVDLWCLPQSDTAQYILHYTHSRLLQGQYVSQWKINNFL